MDRRALLRSGMAAGLAWPALSRAALNFARIAFDPERIFRVTVCTRPFRAQGPRIEAERLGPKLLIHNYGHGGSGWSLSWGSAEAALTLVRPHAPKSIAVIGAGAIGLTTAILAQRTGLKVTVYAKDRFPMVRSARATGAWTPDSRIAKAALVSPDFGACWEAMARASWVMHNGYLGLPGEPVEYLDHYGGLHGSRPEFASLPPEPDPGFWKSGDRIDGLTPESIELLKDQHPFNAETVYKVPLMTFNVTDYAHTLTQDFLQAGGHFVTREFGHPGELTQLNEPVIIHCTGYGARALFKDESLVPYRGQIAWLTPQPEARYGFIYKKTQVLSRRDGIVVQDLGRSENFGLGEDNETPDFKAARSSVALMRDVYRPI